MDFPTALDNLIAGKKIARKSWAYENSYIFAKYTHDKKSMPYVCFVSDDGEVYSGWGARSEDIFAADWFVVK